MSDTTLYFVLTSFMATLIGSMMYVAHRDGKIGRDAARFINDSAYKIAHIYAYRGDGDLAFNWFDRAYRQNDVELWFFLGNLALKPFESNPRYKAFLQTMKLPGLPETSASR
jgi:hypothetical protein